MHFKNTFPIIWSQCTTRCMLCQISSDVNQHGWEAHSLSLRCHAHRTLAKRLMHMVHLSGNTSGVSKSPSDWLNYTGFLGDVCVVFFNVPPETKMLWRQTPSRKKKAVVITTDDEHLSGSTKRWIFKSMWKFYSSRHRIFKNVREFYTLVCYCGDISTPLNMTWRNVIGCFTCQSYGLLGGPWPSKAAKVPSPSAVSLAVWLHETKKRMAERVRDALDESTFTLWQQMALNSRNAAVTPETKLLLYFLFLKHVQKMI